jgi:hypothetical protein
MCSLRMCIPNTWIPVNHTDCRESKMSSTDIRIRKKVVIVGDGACGKVQYNKIDTLLIQKL